MSKIEMKISCIVPVYNAEHFLKKCINSILEQTYKNFEIILVNDGSKDNSAEICRSLQNLDTRITFINKLKNEGVDKARFTGIKYALKTNPNGSITFVDSDDYIEPDSFYRLISELQLKNCDVVEMRFNRCLGLIKRKSKCGIPAQTISCPSLFDDYFISFFGKNILSVNLCGKLFRTELFFHEDIVPSGYRMGEDLILSMKLFPYIKRYSIIDYYGYNYRVGGLTSGYNPFLWDNLKEQFFIKRQCAIEYNYNKALRPLTIELKNILLSAIKQRIIYLKEPKEQLFSWVEEQLNNYKLWCDIKLVLDKTPSDSIESIYNKDAQRLIEIVEQQLAANKWRYHLKNVLVRCIRILSK